ncbi:MAG: DUF542 domain-containing protein [Gemmatimonadaceae bacterium]
MPTPIDINLTINEITQQHPQTLPIFQAVGIDTCCGGGNTLAYVADRHHLDLADLSEKLAQVVALP